MTPVVRERAAFEPGENQVALRADDVFDDAEDVGLELLDLRAVEDRPADADHAGPDFGDGHLRAYRRCNAEQTEDRDAQDDSARQQSRLSSWIRSRYRGEVLTGQGEMGIRFDRAQVPLISSSLLWLVECPLTVSTSPTRRTAVLPSAWWYWSSSRRGNRLGLTCHRRRDFRASSAEPVEEAFF